MLESHVSMFIQSHSVSFFSLDVIIFPIPLA